MAKREKISGSTSAKSAFDLISHLVQEPSIGGEPDPVDSWLKSIEREYPMTGLPGYWTALSNNCEQWAHEAKVSVLWRQAGAQLPSWVTAFRGQTPGAALMSQPALPDFHGKGIARIKSKSYQSAQRNGASSIWSTDRTSASIPRINDLVRTRIRCPYLDGVEFVANKIESLAKEHGIFSNRVRQGRLTGYFAQHVYFLFHTHFRFMNEAYPVVITCEVQVATELASTLWDAAHAVYESWREADEQPEDWQWAPNDPRFIARQLGHMVHLADGLLVQLRDSGHRRKGGSE